MLKKMSLTLAFVGAALSATSASALSITFVPGFGAPSPTANPGPLNGTYVVEDFEGETAGSAYSGGGANIYNTDISGITARPAFWSGGNYLGVQNGPPNFASYSITVPQTQVLSFVLGSLDSYNRVVLKFLNGPNIILDGNQIIAPFLTPADGNQIAPATNGRVFYDTQGSDSIIGADFYSLGANAFEIDNISVAAPEPATWGMMILAAGMAGAALRRRRIRDAMA